MQYKIPVQIENEDPIFLGLSLRQLTIIMIFGGIGYTLLKSLQGSIGFEVALIPSGFIFIIGIVVSIFKVNEMTFVPFFLNLIKNAVNGSTRVWSKGVDSFQPMDIGFVNKGTNKKESKIDFKSKMDKINEIDERLEKL